MTTLRTPSAPRVVLNFFGEAGAGKSTAVNFLAKQGIPAFPRHSPRPASARRAGLIAPGETTPVTQRAFARLLREQRIIAYSYGDLDYAIRPEEVEDILASHRVTAGIIANHDATRALQEHLGSNARVVTIYVATTLENITARLRADGLNPAAITTRTERSHHCRDTHLATPTFFEHTVENNSDRQSFEAELRRIAHHYNNLRHAAA